MVNPEIFKDLDLAALPIGATLLFEGLWCMAEDSGCLEDRDRVIRSEVFGVRDDVTLADIKTWLDALVESGKLQRYEAEGRPYLCIVKFLKHQRFKYLPKTSHPVPDWVAQELRRLYDRRGGSPADSADVAPSLDVIPECSGTFRKNPESSALAGAREAQAQEKRREEKLSKAQAEGADAAPAAVPNWALKAWKAAMGPAPPAPGFERWTRTLQASDAEKLERALAKANSKPHEDLIAMARTVFNDPSGPARNGVRHETTRGDVQRHAGNQGDRAEVRAGDSVLAAWRDASPIVRDVPRSGLDPPR